MAYILNWFSCFPASLAPSLLLVSLLQRQLATLRRSVQVSISTWICLFYTQAIRSMFRTFHLTFAQQTLTFFLNSGLPFLTVATNMSPTPAAGRRFRRPRIPCTAITYRFLAPGKQTNLYIAFHKLKLIYVCVLPVLSAQFITAPTGKPSEMRNLPPAVPPRPNWRKTQIIS